MKCPHTSICPYKRGVLSCIHVSACPFPVMRAPSDDGLTRFEMSRPLFGGRQEQTTVAMHPQPIPYPTTSGTVELKPGQRREIKVYRPRTVHDLWPYLVYGAVSATFAGTAASAFGATNNLSLGIGGTIFVAGFVVTGFKMLFVDGPDPLAMLEELTQVDINGDGVIGPVREEIDVVVNDRSPDDKRLPQQVRLTLFSPTSHPGALARYAAALLRDDETRAAFSYAGGKHVNGASFYGYTKAEFGEFESIAVKAHLVHRERQNQPYELTRRGKATFGRVAQYKLGVMHLSPAPPVHV